VRYKEIQLNVHAGVTKKDANSLRKKMIIRLKKCFEDLESNLRVVTLSGKKNKKLKNYADLKRAVEPLKNIRNIASSKDTNNLGTRIEKFSSDIIQILQDLDWRILTPEKPALMMLETDLRKVCVYIRMIADMEKIIRNPEYEYMNYTNWSFKKEYRRIAGQIKKAFPRFLGRRVTAIGQIDGIRIDFKGKPLESIKDAKNPKKAFIPILNDILVWELMKIGFDMKSSLSPHGDIIWIYLKPEKISPPANMRCENCGAKCESLEHYTSYGRDEFLCGQCYSGYLYCMDP
jgi:hypothetical protein